MTVRFIKQVKYLLILSGLLLSVLYFCFILPMWGFPFNAGRHGNPPLTPAWALECWLWEDDVNTAEPNPTPDAAAAGELTEREQAELDEDLRDLKRRLNADDAT